MQNAQKYAKFFCVAVLITSSVSAHSTCVSPSIPPSLASWPQESLTPRCGPSLEIVHMDARTGRITSNTTYTCYRPNPNPYAGYSNLELQVMALASAQSRAAAEAQIHSYMLHKEYVKYMNAKADYMICVNRESK